MNAVVLIGHGSLLSDSGKAMIRLAAQLQKRGIAPIVRPGFLNYSQPTLAEAIADCVEAGAAQITVQPYFLIDGKYVREDLAGEIAQMAAHYPYVTFAMAEVFGPHRLLTDIVFDRIRAADPALGMESRPAALLFMAHGSPFPEANAPIERIAARVHARADYCQAVVSYLDCNQPTIDAAIDQLTADGANRIITVPYFLHEGRHTQRDLPAILGGARHRHPQVDFRTAAHLGYDLRFVEIITDRVKAAKEVERERVRE
ncbi:MAG: sirohydrochlorin chelatase [Caldilineaceae bacterium]|nr:sirohydrochlorin chelatase [Caldilineaceae bacterium]